MRNHCANFDFSKQSVTKSTIVTELCMEKIHLQILLSDVGHSNFRRLVVFCTEKEWGG
jgi:hypothetical protein